MRADYDHPDDDDQRHQHYHPSHYDNYHPLPEKLIIKYWSRICEGSHFLAEMNIWRTAALVSVVHLRKMCKFFLFN